MSISKYLMCLGFYGCFSCTDVDVVENQLEETEDIRLGLTLADGWKELDRSHSSSERSETRYAEIREFGMVPLYYDRIRHKASGKGNG